MTTEQRLDRIEDEFETVKSLLMSAARYAESANEGLDELTIKVDNLTVRVDQLAVAQERTQIQLDQLGVRVDQLAESQTRSQARLDEFIFQSQRLLLNQGERVSRLEAQGETLVGISQYLIRNFEAYQSELREFRQTTSAALERIDRVLDYLVRQLPRDNEGSDNG